jgi:FkbM family methyltransferase
MQAPFRLRVRKEMGQRLRSVGLYPIVKLIELKLAEAGRSKRESDGIRARFFSEFIRPGDLCFDVGANIGDRTAIFTSLGAKVVSVEPQPEVLAVLRRRFRRSQNVTIVPLGVAARRGRQELAICDRETQIATFSEKWQNESRYARQNMTWGSKLSVEVVTLDDLIERFGRPAFCKIDVEGYEAEVLAGLNQAIDCCFFEFSKEILEEAFKCIDKLESLGLDEFNVSFFDSMHLELSAWLPASEFRRKLAEHPDPALVGDIVARCPFASRIS